MASINNTLRLNDQMAPVLQNIVKALDATLTAMSTVNRTGRREFRGAQAAVDDLRNSVNQLSTTVSRGNSAGRNSQQEFTNSVRNSSSVMDELIGKAKTLLATYLGFQGIANIVTGGDAFIGNVARLDLMNDGLQTTKELQDEIYRASQRSLGNYVDMQRSVAKLGITASKAFKNTKEIVAFTELLNKQFTIGGASASERAGATYQLTQAMASGRLQGDEFRSILENAPMLMQAIQRSTGMDFAQLKKASTKGLITSDVIKNALFKIADETNKKFAEMPMSFADLWRQAVNIVEKNLEKLYVRLRELWNNKDFQIFLQGMVQGFTNVVHFGIWAFESLSAVGAVMYNNWDLIAPVLWSVVGAMTAYGAGVAILRLMAFWTKVHNTALLINVGLQTLHINGLRKQIGVTGAAIAAQWGLNAALLANPFGLIVLAVIAFIGVLYLVIGVINRITGETYSATGVIVGIVMWLAAALGNIVIGLLNGLVQLLWTIFVEPCLAGIEFWLNAFNGGFNNFGDACKNLIGQIIGWFLQLGQVVTKIIDAIFGTNWTQGLESLRMNVQTWGMNENATFIDRSAPMPVKRIEYNQAWDAGYKMGEMTMDSIKNKFKIGDKESGLENLFPKGFSTSIGPDPDILKALQGTEKNTKKTADKITDDDMELLKEVAKVQFVNKFTTLTPNVNASFGNIYQNADANKILQIIEQSVLTAVQAGLSI